MKIKASALHRWISEILQRGGSDTAESELVSDHLVIANLKGHDSHGVGMIPSYIKNLKADLLNPNQPVELLKDNGAILVFDGQWGYGQRVAREAMDFAIKRCRETGIVVFALRQAHHIGRVGSYGEQSAAAGLVSLHFVNVTGHNPLVAAYGGSEARFVTNPLCLAMPGTEKNPPVILDMATSRVAMGKVRVAMNKGVSLADGLVIDPQGHSSNDPGVMFREPKGALLPFGEHKGSGLALFCEMLAGALAGGKTIQPGNERHGSIINNMLAILIDPQQLVEQPWMQTEIDALIEYVKSARPVDPETPVMVAGDPERNSMAIREKDGIPIDDTTWEQLLEAGEAVGVTRAQALQLALEENH